MRGSGSRYRGRVWRSTRYEESARRLGYPYECRWIPELRSFNLVQHDMWLSMVSQAQVDETALREMAGYVFSRVPGPDILTGRAVVGEALQR